MSVGRFHSLEEEVRFFEEARVVRKHTVLPPRPVRREKEETGLTLLEDKQTAPMKKRAASNFNRTPSNRINAGNISLQRQKENSRPKSKIVNAAEKRRQEQEDAKREKKERDEQEFKRRQAQVRKRMERMQEQKERQKVKKQEEKKAERQEEEEKKRRQRQEKERYQKDQKDKLERYKREKQDKEKQQKQRQRDLRQKQDEERKDKAKVHMKRQEERRKDEAERKQKERELSEDNKRKKKEEEEKKKELLKKQVMKKLQGEKERFEIQKLMKELLKKIYQQPDIQGTFETHRQELRSMFGYGKEYNEYKLGGATNQTLEQKGWITLCQQFGLCDVKTANGLIKQNQKEKGRAGFTYDDFLETLLNLGVGRQIEDELEDYEKAHKASAARLQKYIRSLKIPKDKQTMKEYFVGLKNSLKKKEQVQVTAPNGEKQTWEMQE